jgi:hypothetical protein
MKTIPRILGTLLALCALVAAALSSHSTANLARANTYTSLTIGELRRQSSLLQQQCTLLQQQYADLRRDNDLLMKGVIARNRNDAEFQTGIGMQFLDWGIFTSYVRRDIEVIGQSFIRAARFEAKILTADSTAEWVPVAANKVKRAKDGFVLETTLPLVHEKFAQALEDKKSVRFSALEAQRSHIYASDFVDVTIVE